MSGFKVARRFLSSNLNVIKNQSLIRTKGFVNGEWISSSSNSAFEVRNPAVDDIAEGKLADVLDFVEQDFNHAVDKAYNAFNSYKKTTGRYKSQLLSNLYNLMIENGDDLARLITLENGKPLADSLGEVKFAASFFQWFSEEAPRLYGEVIPSTISSNKIITLKQPVGVCGILAPWNFPAAMITRKVGAALATGCSSVIKPPGETPLSSLALAGLIEEAGIPPGVVNILPSSNAPAIGELLCEHPKILKISFTGSTAVGKLLMSQSASTLKELSMELGGNAPFIVFDDVNIADAVNGAIASKFRSSGQTCICANRIYVHESIYDEFVEKFVDQLQRTVKLGNGLEEGVTHGPVIHEKSMSKVRHHIEDAVSKGAKVLYGGNKRPDIGQNFHELTVLTDVTSDMAITKEETFGPVAPIIKFSTDDEVIGLANDTKVGLAGYFYSNNIKRIFRTAEALQVGMMGVNTGLISEAPLPFGGVAESGYGREGSMYGAQDYMDIKTVVLGGLD